MNDIMRCLFVYQVLAVVRTLALRLMVRHVLIGELRRDGPHNNAVAPHDAASWQLAHAPRCTDPPRLPQAPLRTASTMSYSSASSP